MAISDLLPRKAMGSKTRGQTLQARIKYDQKEEKTKDGELVSSYMCCPETAAEEFEMSKLLYETSTGRSQPQERDIIVATHLSCPKINQIDCHRMSRYNGISLKKGKVPGHLQFRHR